MKPERQARTFFFEDCAVGYFMDEQLPSVPGQYRYMPYRGPGHYRLGVALKSRGPQRCHYAIGEEKHYFTVQTLVSYGLLELAGFDPVDPPAS